MAVGVQQNRAQAGGDITGGDKITNNTFIDSRTRPSKVEGLMIKLKEQIECNDTARDTIQKLARHYEITAEDGISGLEQKLEAANMSAHYRSAIRQKEIFVKLLEKFSLYSSAIDIFSHFLSKAGNTFNYEIYPKIEQLDDAELFGSVRKNIIDPIVEECGSDVFSLDYDHVFGMIYWLAEQCFIRWHK